MKLLKLIFYADRAHLTLYGRPIVGGTYYVMEYGPLSSEMYGDIKSANRLENIPYTTEGRDVVSIKKENDDYLSESDIKIIDKIDAEFGPCAAKKLSTLTHELSCYTKNFKEDSEAKRFFLPYEDFFLDLPDKGILGVIREDQEAERVFD